jgi:hypothetical protein
MALAFVIVIAPNFGWLVQHDFLPFHYVDERARSAAHWYQYILYPLQWTGGQFLLLLPMLGLLVLLRRRGEAWRPTFAPTGTFDARYVTALALGPFLVTTAIAAVLGRLVIIFWGYPLWLFAPLALLLWWGRGIEPAQLRRFALGFLAVFVAFPLAYAAVEIGEPFLRDRPKATQYPGEVMAEAITRAWRESYGTPLVYAGGIEFPVNNLAVYSPDRPHVIVHGEPNLSPWIDMDDVRRRGAVLVWDAGDYRVNLERWREIFGPFEVQPTLVLARQTWHPVSPVRTTYAFVPPRP